MNIFQTFVDELGSGIPGAKRARVARRVAAMFTPEGTTAIGDLCGFGVGGKRNAMGEHLFSYLFEEVD